MDEDDILGGLNDMMEMADKPDVVKKAAVSKAAACKAARKANPEPESLIQPLPEPKIAEAMASTEDQPSSPLAQQILTRLDEIKAQMADALSEKPAPESVEKSEKAPEKPVSAKKSAPEKPVVPKTRSVYPVSGPAAALIVVAGMLLSFAMGMGYGAIVATQHFPDWFHAGLSGALTDWVAAPAGILLFPVISGLFFRAGNELRMEKEDKASRLFYGLAVAALIMAVGLPLVVV